MKLLYLLLFISGTVNASPSSTLYVKIKDNDVCVFTKVDYDKAYENLTLIYMGKVDEINAFHSSYSKTYLNLKMPITEKTALKLNLLNLKSLLHMMLFLKQADHMHKAFA